jgi:hypothetical protein
MQEITLPVHYPVYLTQRQPVHMQHKIETLRVTIVTVGKTKIIAYFKCAFLDYCIQHVMRMRRIIRGLIVK